MSQSIISISNRSLLAVGARAQIGSLNEGSTESNACSTLFLPTYEALARAAKWNCFRAQITLSLLAAATGTSENPNGTTLPLPPNPWLYQYLYPVQCLALRFLVPSSPATATGVPPTPVSLAAPIFIPGNGQIPFEVAYGTDPTGNPLNVILTNQQQAQAVYTIDQPDPSNWDSQFQAAMVSSLAAYLVPALSLDLSLMQMSIKNAESIIAQARATDANEATISQDSVPDWIRARAAGAGVGWYGYGYGYNGAQFGGFGMPWPG